MKNIDAIIIKQLYEHIERKKKSNELTDFNGMENLTNKALAILQEAGIFSMSLFLKYQGRKNPKAANFILEFIRKLIEENLDIFGAKKSDKDSFEAIREYINHISSDIYKTMFLANIIYQGLVYLRYHLKSNPEK